MGKQDRRHNTRHLSCDIWYTTPARLPDAVLQVGIENTDTPERTWPIATVSVTIGPVREPNRRKQAK